MKMVAPGPGLALLLNQFTPTLMTYDNSILPRPCGSCDLLQGSLIDHHLSRLAT